MVDAFNRPKGHFAEGRYDTLAVSGEGLKSSLDKELQKLGEKLMNHKIGSIVAIEPSTGEILTDGANVPKVKANVESSKLRELLNNLPGDDI
jgi:cell division protein FtsI/penicillin-binding protein 2